VLTGTPMENLCSTCGAIIDFLMPGYLGSATDFRGSVRAAHHARQDEAVQAAARAGLRRSYLRRLKTEVAKDLPRSSYKCPYFELPRDQRNIQAKCSVRKPQGIMEAVGAQGVARAG